MDIKIKAVKNHSDVLKFIKCQWQFYKKDKNWVPPVIADRLKLLDTEKNPFYQHSRIQLFLAYKGSEIVGRIAAIINSNHNKTHEDKVGFYGFFECIDNQEVANTLFSTAEKWLGERGFDTMRGPANPSFNDEVGLLIEGFEYPPAILMTYNPEYYIPLHENYGLKKAKDLFAYRLLKAEYSTEKLVRAQKLIRERYKITIREVNFKNKKHFMKDIEQVRDMYNKAWEKNWGFVKMTDAEFDFAANDLKQFAEQKLIFFAEFEGVPAGFVLSLPDINQCLIHNRSGSLPGAIWHLLTRKKKITSLRVLLLGVLPEYRKTGVDAVLYYETGIRGTSMGIVEGEASWILEDNEMLNRALTSTTNNKVFKVYRIYDKKITQ